MNRVSVDPAAAGRSPTPAGATGVRRAGSGYTDSVEHDIGEDEVANLTITVDDEVLRRARLRALQQGTSVNRLLGEYLARYADVEATRGAVDRFLRLSEDAPGASGPGGRTWTRDEAHERARVR
jgi:hypothetical protein